MATLREFSGVQEISFQGEFDVIFGEAIYKKVEKELHITGLVTELFGDDLYDKEKKKLDLPTTPVTVKIPLETYTREWKKSDGSIGSFEVKATPGLVFGAKLLQEQIEPEQPFKGQLSFKLPQPLINAYETGKNARGQEVSKEIVLQQIEDYFWTEKLDTISFKMPEAGKRGGGNYTPKETEKDRLETRFKFLVEKLGCPTEQPNIYDLYFTLVENCSGDEINQPTLMGLIDIIMG